MDGVKHKDIQTRCKSARPSRRSDLLEGQWEQKRFERHRSKVASAEPRIDDRRPVSSLLSHVQVKAKKKQKEAERCMDVMMCNLILLRHLAEIAMSKRVDDGNRPKKMHWKDYYAAILLMRRQQIERLRVQMDKQQQQNKLQVPQQQQQVQQQQVQEPAAEKEKQEEKVPKKGKEKKEKKEKKSKSKKKEKKKKRSSSKGGGKTENGGDGGKKS